MTTAPAAAGARDRDALILEACIAIPLLVLGACYAWLAVEHGRTWLWNTVVHESGRYTFGQTVLYASHFLREVPTLLAYALFLLGAGAGLTPRVAHGSESGRAPVARVGAVAALAAAAAAAIIVTALLVTAAHDGWHSALLDLLQYRTRDDLAEFGTHWHFHWLSTLWFGAVALLVPGALRAAGGTGLRPHRGYRLAGWLYFGALTLGFGLSRAVFVDVRYAGHQAREILTHAPVTALLGIALLLAAARVENRTASGRGMAPGPIDGGQRAVGTELPRSVLLGAVLLAVAIPAWLAVTALSGDVMAAGQSQLGLSAMVGAHYYEHALDYVVVLLLVGAALLLRVYRAARTDVHVPPAVPV